MQIPVFPLLLALTGILQAADAADAFRPWSAVAKYDVAKLARGRIETASNGSMAFERGISAQAVFIVAASPETAVRALLSSDPTKRPEQETYKRTVFYGDPEGTFAKVRLDPIIPAVRRLLEMMRKRQDLHLLREESEALPKDAKTESAERFWENTLALRWSRWTQRGELRATETFDVRGEISSLLKAEPAIARHFIALLTPFTRIGAPAEPAQHYWELSNVNGTAAFCLGTIYTRVAEGRWQVLDVTYYAANGYLTSVTLYEMLPITLEGRVHALVWEACLVSAPALAGGFGVKKAVGSRLMVGDLEKSVRFFQQDSAALR